LLLLLVDVDCSREEGVEEKRRQEGEGLMRRGNLPHRCDLHVLRRRGVDAGNLSIDKTEKVNEGKDGFGV
jgi:hypothetical protein